MAILGPGGVPLTPSQLRTLQRRGSSALPGIVGKSPSTGKAPASRVRIEPKGESVADRIKGLERDKEKVLAEGRKALAKGEDTTKVQKRVADLDAQIVDLQGGVFRGPQGQVFPTPPGATPPGATSPVVPAARLPFAEEAMAPVHDVDLPFDLEETFEEIRPIALLKAKTRIGGGSIPSSPSPNTNYVYKRRD